MEEILAMLRLGVVCYRSDPKERPAMSVVLDMLANIKKTKHANANPNPILSVSAPTRRGSIQRKVSIQRYLEK
jgi:hypothetical protein